MASAFRDDELRKQTEKLANYSQQLRRDTSAAKSKLQRAARAQSGNIEQLREMIVALNSGAVAVEAVVTAIDQKFGTAPTEESAPVDLEMHTVAEYRSQRRTSLQTVADARNICLSGGGTLDKLKDGDFSIDANDLVQVLDNDQVQELHKMELREVAAEATALRDITQEIHQMTLQQGEQLNQVEANVDSAEEKVAEGRRQLSQAAKYKMGAMCIGGAIVGGLIGGPLGAFAGAKSAMGLLACAAAGSATGVIATKQLTSSVENKLDEEADEVERDGQELQTSHGQRRKGS